MPASSSHFTILFLLRVFIQKLATTSGSLQLCPEIIYNILVVPEFIQSILNVLIVLADTTQFGKRFLGPT